MDILGKDEIEYIFRFLSPIDWYCTSLVCKSWWVKIKKFLSDRKKLFYKRLDDVLSDGNGNGICLRPLYYLQPLYSGCQGEINNFVCLRHSENSDLCQNCLQNPVSKYSFGDYCDSPKCRDYIIILRNGKAECVKAYSCSVSQCQGKTDRVNGLCYNHAVADFHKNKKVENLKSVYNCISKTQKGINCQNSTKSRIKKCHMHIKGPMSIRKN